MTPSLSSVREQLPCLAREVYLNAGGAGPLALAAGEAIEATTRRDLLRGRMSPSAIEEAISAVEMLRAELGALVGGGHDEVALTGNTTAGQCAVIWGLSWGEGDEVLTTGIEHPGLSAPLDVLRRRRGVAMRVIPGDEAEEDLSGAVRRRASSSTRLVAVSHVSYSTGAVLDIAGAAASARQVDALTLVDGAQAVGAIPVDVDALGVDAYAFPAQKWLCGPEGLGGLWVGRRAQERVDMTFASFESGVDHRTDGSFTPHAEARRYETSTPALSLVPGWRAALAWLEGLGWGWVHEGVERAQRDARERLSAIPAVEIITPPGRQAGLLTFTVDGVDPEALGRALARDDVVLRWLAHPKALRVSTGFYTNDADLERLATGISGAVG